MYQRSIVEGKEQDEGGVWGVEMHEHIENTRTIVRPLKKSGMISLTSFARKFSETRTLSREIPDIHRRH